MNDLHPDICSMMSKKVKYKKKHCNYKVLNSIEDSLVDDSASSSSRGRKPKRVINTYQSYFNDCVDIDKLRTMNRDVEDVLVGVARLNWYRSEGGSTPLSVKKFVYLFRELEVFTVKGIGDCLELGDTQSKIYMRACELVLKHLDRIKELPYDEVEQDFKDFDSWFGDSQ